MSVIQIPLERTPFVGFFSSVATANMKSLFPHQFSKSGCQASLYLTRSHCVIIVFSIIAELLISCPTADINVSVANIVCIIFLPELIIDFVVCLDIELSVFVAVSCQYCWQQTNNLGSWGWPHSLFIDTL
jgi:hypothetical protein